MAKIKRLLTGAWNLCFCWLAEEPGEHHAAMPRAVLGACLVVSLSCGWLEIADLPGLCWAGLLRPPEALLAMRQQLCLPSDTKQLMPFCLLSVLEPKTRSKDPGVKQAESTFLISYSYLSVPLQHIPTQLYGGLPA